MDWRQKLINGLSEKKYKRLKTSDDLYQDFIKKNKHKK
jgi:hypothetical protein